MTIRDKNIDLGWFERHILTDILPVWLHHSPTSNGFFLSHFDEHFKLMNDNTGTLVSQSRMIYNFCMGYNLTGDPSYYMGAVKGADFLINNFYDKKYGGYFFSCDSDGNVIDELKFSYGQVFVIFGLAHICRLTGEQKYKQAAIQALDELDKFFGDEFGGLYWYMSRDFKPTCDFKSQNSLMHLYEALLVLAELDGMSYILEKAQTVAEFVLKLSRPSSGLLPELFDVEWKEKFDAPNSRIDIGHAFEWAYLLSAGVERGLPDRFLTHAENFLEYGIELGYDSEQGGIFSPAEPKTLNVVQTKNWWEQTEAIRAMLNFYFSREHKELFEPLSRTIDFVKNQMIDPRNGGWFSKIDDKNDQHLQLKGFPGKNYYHIMGMAMEAIRIKKIVSN